jgi:hypothetical protein
MCYSFSGDNAMPQATRLAEELRDRFKLKTYIYTHKFDLTKSIPQEAGWKLQDTEDETRKLVVPQKFKPAGQAQFEEVAVLVGDFPTIDDNRAQTTLEKIKSLMPDSLRDFDPIEADQGEALAPRVRLWRTDASTYKRHHKQGSKGPLGSAFLLTNPTLPDEYFQAQKVDTFVMDLNKPVKHSLLKNPKPYTVRVASFRGDSTFNLDEIQEKQKEFSWLKRNKSAVQSSLMEAAGKANKLCEAFRAEGIEAYEFHDRHESYVCVGSFDWIVKEDSAGNKRQNPEVVETIMKYKGTIESFPNMPNAVRPFVLPSMKKEGIACDVQPVPVLVPRASAEVRTASGILGRFR